MLAQEWWNVCVNMVTVESDVRGNRTSFASSSLQQTHQPSNLFTFLVFFPPFKMCIWLLWQSHGAWGHVQALQLQEEWFEHV